MRSNQGLSLIELLVAIGIIGILIGIVVPALGVVRANAVSVSCANNMRQIFTGASAFAAENRQQFPSNRIKTEINSHLTWRYWLATKGYVQTLKGLVEAKGPTVGDFAMANGTGQALAAPEKSVWECPGGINDPLREERDGPSKCVGDIASSYAYNGELAWRAYPLTTSEANPSDVRLVTFKRPSTILAFVETRSWWPDLQTWSVIGRNRFPGASEDGAGYFAFAHRNRSNWVFMDGHVERLGVLETRYPINRWTENPDSGPSGDWRVLVAPRYLTQ